MEIKENYYYYESDVVGIKFRIENLRHLADNEPLILTVDRAVVANMIGSFEDAYAMAEDRAIDNERLEIEKADLKEMVRYKEEIIGSLQEESAAQKARINELEGKLEKGGEEDIIESTMSHMKDMMLQLKDIELNQAQLKIQQLEYELKTLNGYMIAARDSGFSSPTQHTSMVQDQSKLTEVVVVQEILNQLKNESVRSDFLQGSSKACLIEAAEMNFLEQFSKHTSPVHPNFSNEPSFFRSAKMAADHLKSVIDGDKREFLDTGSTYENIEEVLSRIATCGYWKRRVTSPTSMTQERPAESDTAPSSDDLESKEDKIDLGEMKITSSSPLSTQVPDPTHLVNDVAHPMMAHPQQHHANPVHQMNAVQQSQQQQQIPMKPVTKTVVVIPTVKKPIDEILRDFVSSNFSFLQDSEIEQQQQQQAVHVAANSQAQQPKIPPNSVSQSKHSPVHANADQPNLDSIHQQPTQTHQHPASVSQQQYSQNLPSNIQNIQDSEQKTTALAQQQIAPTRDLSHDLSEPRTAHTFQQEKEKSRDNEWNPASTQQNKQPPQIDTWNANDASMGYSGGNQGGNYLRFNRNRSGTGGGGSSGNAKYKNDRSSQQSRSNYNNESGGDSTGGRGKRASKTKFKRLYTHGLY